MPEDLDLTWKRICHELRHEVTDFTFHVWLEPLELAGRSGATLFVRAPAHARAWIRDRYLPILTRAASRVLDEGANVQIVAHDWAGSAAASTDRRGPRSVSTDMPLNPKYTFDQFVIGDSNRLAHAAALTVAELPAHAYNPLFIYGPPGVGKTHLQHAIGNYLRAYGAGMTVRYATVETFTAEFVEALRARDAAAFKERFRGADVLLIDDVQFLAEKVRTAEEFFHTFNALYESGRQLVITCDRAPRDMDRFETRLRERFGAGLVAELEPPDLHVRLAILRKRAELDGLTDIDEQALAEIASRVTVSVRALEGSLVRLVAYASLRAAPITLALVRQALESSSSIPVGHACTVHDVQVVVARRLGVDEDLLSAHDRRPHATRARQIAMYLARELTTETLPAIGSRFGNRAHSTVLHAHRKVSQELQADPTTRHVVHALAHELAGQSV